jgi:hypothetical protein
MRTRYLPAYERDGLKELLASNHELQALAQALHDEKVSFKLTEEQLRTHVRTTLSDAGVPVNAKTVRNWFDTHDRGEWTRSIVTSGELRGLYEMPDGVDWDYRRVPSAHTFLCYQQARIVQTLGEGRTIKESDLADAHHAAAGPYYDILVTDDHVFGLALDLVGSRSFRWMTSAEFASKYLAL